MRIIDGNLLEGDWEVAFHCANPHKIMGSGVAYALKTKWPEVEVADNVYKVQDPEKRLGDFSSAYVENYEKIVVNLYGQVGVGCDGNPLNRNCSYDHLFNAMYKVCKIINDEHDGFFPTKIGVPYKMACDRAGGAWRIVEAMLVELEDMFENIEFTAYRLDESKERNQSSVTIPK